MELIYKQHAKTVYKYLMSLCGNPDLAEELTQETFYRAIYSIKTYDGSCKVSVWLCQIAKHIWYQELDKRNKLSSVELDNIIPAGDISIENSISITDDKIKLFSAIHMLDEPMREVMYLRLTGEFSFREIGELLGKKENWARVTFYRGKQKLVKGDV